MTNFTTRMMIAAATCVAAAGAASAQTMKAEIPFTFRTNGATLPAGAYRVTLNHGMTAAPLLVVQSEESRASALASAKMGYDAPKAWRAAGKPVLAFECGSKVCSLVGLWNGTPDPAYAFPAPKPGKNEPTHMALVVLQTEKGD